jgi:glycosyltransferase involved in cell wall biosynthesis
MISVVSTSTKKQLLRYIGCDPRKIHVIPPPVLELFQPSKKEFNPQKPTILHIGTTFNKNLSRLAKALRGVPCHLRIIGGLSKNYLKSLQEEDIEFSNIENISEELIVKEYENCDMVAFVSVYEGFGMPITEANAVGRPIVTSNVFSMPEAADGAACLVNPYDVESIRGGILRVIWDTPYREGLVHKGYENAKRFRPQMIAGKYADLYRELHTV